MKRLKSALLIISAHMTGAAVLRARRTRAGLAQSQGARGWARRQRRPLPPPRRAARSGGPRGPRPGEGATSGLAGAPASPAGSGGFAGGQGHAGGAGLGPRGVPEDGRSGEDTGRQGPDLHPPILSPLLPPPRLSSVLDANLCCKI